MSKLLPFSSVEKGLGDEVLLCAGTVALFLYCFAPRATFL
jgi:hypothetical protein